MSDITLTSPLHNTYSLPTAHFWRRVNAALIDLFLLTFLVFFVTLAFPDLREWFFYKKASQFSSYNSTFWVLSKSSIVVLWIAYSVIMDCTTMQGTIGKQMLGIVVTDNAGKRLTITQSAVRNFFKIISYAILGLGFLNVLWDKENRGWHDLAANTLVVRKGVRK